MQLTVTTIKTGEKMFACLQNADRKEIAAFIRFYRTFKENGMLKYRIEKSR